MLVAAIAALVFVLAGGAAVALFLTRDTGPHYPKEWDARVTDIVKFDEATRGLKYKHPVKIEFMSEDDFTKTLTAEDGPTDEEKAQMQQFTAAYRALGLIGGDVDLLQQTQDIQSGGTLAYYDPKTKVIRVRGTEMTPALRVTLAHEMTHVLQDQYFDLNRLEKIKDDGAQTAFRAVVEGDAVGVENAYIDQLSPADKQAYDDENQKSGDSSGYDKAPQVLVANFTSPYIVGPPFVATLKAKGGNPAVDEAIKTPPASEAALLDLFTYLKNTTPLTVQPPDLGEGQTKIDASGIGATTWYLMLARRLPAADAIKSIDGWGGDSSLTYTETTGRVCVKARYQGKTSADTDTMAALLDEWVAQSPADTALTTRDGSVIELQSCDPGKDAVLPGTDRSVLAMELLAVRLQIVQSGYEQGAKASRVECFSDQVVAGLSLDDLSDTADQAQVKQKVASLEQSAALTCPS